MKRQLEAITLTRFSPLLASHRSNTLSNLASDLDIAVVCTNHLTTQFNSDDKEFIPALGLNISSQFDVHVELSKTQVPGEVLAKVKKGAREGTTAMFTIGENGIRDIKKKPKPSATAT